MLEDQEQHLERLKRDFCAALDAKYRKGASEHGDVLWTMPRKRLLGEALAEVVDLWAYLKSEYDKTEGQP